MAPYINNSNDEEHTIGSMVPMLYAVHATVSATWSHLLKAHSVKPYTRQHVCVYPSSYISNLYPYCPLCLSVGDNSSGIEK